MKSVFGIQSSRMISETSFNQPTDPEQETESRLLIFWDWFMKERSFYERQDAVDWLRKSAP